MNGWRLPVGRSAVSSALRVGHPGAIAAATVAVVLLTRLRGQPAQVRRRLAVAGAVSLAGALAMGTVSGLALRADGARQADLIVTASRSSWFSPARPCCWRRS